MSIETFCSLFEWLFCLFCFVFIELCELFVYFGNKVFVGCIICKYFLPVHRLSFCFVSGFLCCAKVYKFDFFIFVFSSFALGGWHKKYFCGLCQRMLCLFWEFYSVVSYIEVFKPFWVYFCLWGYVLTSLIYMQLSNFPNTTCWRDWFFSIVFSCVFIVGDELTIGMWVYFWAVYSVPLIRISFLFFFFGQYHAILITQLCNIVSSLGGLCLQFCSFFLELETWKSSGEGPDLRTLRFFFFPTW